jgi:D-alanyl-D-alanine carboxypeptidase (penicillin-binding protein 5/6)
MKRRLRLVLLITVGILLIAGGYSYWALNHAAKPLVPTTLASSDSAVVPPATLAWPSSGQSAVGVLGTSILTTHNAQTPVPTASCAKLITALMILRTKPLQLNQPGPDITLNANDLDIYKAYVAEQGSVVPVQLGEQLSEYQMLEAMLLPSANNIADSLAIWAYGSLPAYSAAANTYIQSLDLTQTHVGSDASGFLPTTTSTAQDLVHLGEIVMKNPILSQIVGQKMVAGIPLAPNLKNVNWLLGTDNIIGVKTGNTTQAGGVFIGAAKATVNNQVATVITAEMGSPTLQLAMNQSLPLIASSQTNFSSLTLASAGQVVGSYYLPWTHSSVQAVTNQPLIASAWKGSTLDNNSANLASLSYPASAGQVVGSLSNTSGGLVNSTSVTISLSSPITPPPVWWRLTHP